MFVWHAYFCSQAWGHHFGLRDHHLLALAAAERQLLESEYDDYSVANAGNVTYLRSIAIVVRPHIQLSSIVNLILTGYPFPIYILQCLRYSHLHFFVVDVCLANPSSADDYKRFWAYAGVFDIFTCKFSNRHLHK